MILTILDPCTGNRVTVEVPAKRQPRRVRRQVLRKLDQVDLHLEEQAHKPR